MSISYKEIMDMEYSSDNGFEVPRDETFIIPVFKICKVCSKITFTRKVSIFDHSPVVICSHCGCRHRISYKRVVSKTVFTLILVFCILFTAINLAISFFGDGGNGDNQKTDNKSETTTVDAVESLYNSLASSGLKFKGTDTLYCDHNFDAEKVNPKDGAVGYPISYYFEEGSGVLWLEFSAKSDGEKQSVWYPYPYSG